MFGAILTALGVVSAVAGVGILTGMVVAGTIALPLLAVAVALTAVGFALVYFGIMSVLDEECKRFVDEVIAKMSFDWKAPPFIPFTLSNVTTIEGATGITEGLNPNDYKVYVDYGTGTYMIDFTIRLQIDAERSLKAYGINALDLVNKPGEIFADFVKASGEKIIGGMKLANSVSYSMSANTSNNVINSVVKEFVRQYTAVGTNEEGPYESVESILRFPGGLVVESGALSQGIDSVLSRLYLLPLSRNIQATKFYLFVMIKDGITGAVKYADIRRFTLPLAIFRVRGWSKACQMCGKQSIYWTAPYYFVALLDGDKISVRFIGTSKHPIKPGDLVEIWVGSPYLFYAIKWFCCDYCGYVDPINNKCKKGVKPCPRDDKCKQFCTTVMAGKQSITGNICTAEACSSGEILFPNVFVNFLKNVGFYNEDIVKMAKLLANTGFLIPLAEGGIPLTIQNFEVVGDFKFDVEGFIPEKGQPVHVLCSANVSKCVQGGNNCLEGTNCQALEDYLTVEKIGDKLYVRLNNVDSMLMFRYTGPRGGVSVTSNDISGRTLKILVDPNGEIVGDTGFGLIALGALGARNKVLFLPFIQDLGGPQAIWILPGDPNCYNVEVSGKNVNVTLNPDCPIIKNLDKNSIGYRLITMSATRLGYLLTKLMYQFDVELKDIVSTVPAINAVKEKALEKTKQAQG